MAQRNLVCSTPRLFLHIRLRRPYRCLLPLTVVSVSVIGLLLAEGAFSYCRLYPLSSPLHGFDSQSPPWGKPVTWFFTCFRPRTKALGLGFLGYSPHLKGHQVIISVGLKCELYPLWVTTLKPVILEYFYSFLLNESH